VTWRAAITGVHVALSCGVVISWGLALVARQARWRRHHRRAGCICCVLVVLSSLLALGLAVAGGNRFGAVFALQPLVLVLSGLAWQRAGRRVVQTLGGVGLVTAAAVMHGFVQFLATRAVIDVLAFAVTAGVATALAAQDVLARPRPAPHAHAWRLLAAGWFYLAEGLIFVADPHPSVIAWGLAALAPVAAWGVLRRTLPVSRLERAHG
jgi:hypothetical protein